jgi:photosystem II stability/assembly factor-like uncharacterized protein
MKNIIYALLSFFLLPLNSYQAHAQWLPLEGIYGSQVNCLLANGKMLMAGTAGNGVFKFNADQGSWLPSDSGLRFGYVNSLLEMGYHTLAGTKDGIYVTKDDGATWQRSSKGLPFQNDHFCSVNALTTIGKSILAGTTSGIFKSDDLGKTWYMTSTGLINIGAFATCNVNPNGLHIFVSCDQGIYCSIDSGYTWSCTAFKAGYANTLLTCRQRLIAGTSNGVFCTNDLGNSWNAQSNGLTNLNINCFFKTSKWIFAGTKDGIYFSKPDSIFWNLCDLQGVFISSMTAADTDSQIIYCGTNGGVFFTEDSTIKWKSLKTKLKHPCINTLVSCGGKLFSGSSSGLFVSANNGFAWNPINIGIPEIPVYSLAAKNNYLVAGTSVGVFLSIDYGNTWSKSNTWSSQEPAYFVGIQATPHFDTFFYACGTNKAVKSSDGGKNWTEFMTSIPDLYSFTSFSVSDGEIYTATYPAGIYRSVDQGQNWQNITYGMKDMMIQTIMPGPFQIFLGTSNGVWYCDKNDTIWKNMSDGFPDMPQGIGTSSLFIINSIIVAGTNNGIYIADSAGLPWKPINTAFPEDAYGFVPVTCIASFGVNIFAGTPSSGLWMRPLIEIVSGMQKNGFPSGKMQLYPNPASDIIRLKFSAPTKGNSMLEVLNFYGQKVVFRMLESGIMEYAINIKDLQAGYYLISLQYKGEILENRIFIKE